MVNPVEGKIVIDVSRKYVSIFRCDGDWLNDTINIDSARDGGPEGKTE